jgi:hypothetical protein
MAATPASPRKFDATHRTRRDFDRASAKAMDPPASDVRLLHSRFSAVRLRLIAMEPMMRAMPSAVTPVDLQHVYTWCSSSQRV